MAGSKSDYLENAILNAILGGPAFALPPNIFIALSTAAYSDAATGTSMSEVSSAGTAYGRVAQTNNATNWPASSGGTKSNGTVITFNAATADWGTVNSFYIVDTLSAGNILYGADLTTPRTVVNGDTASFAVGAIAITEN